MYHRLSYGRSLCCRWPIIHFVGHTPGHVHDAMHGFCSIFKRLRRLTCCRLQNIRVENDDIQTRILWEVNLTCALTCMAADCVCMGKYSLKYKEIMKTTFTIFGLVSIIVFTKPNFHDTFIYFYHVISAHALCWLSTEPDAMVACWPR